MRRTRFMSLLFIVLSLAFLPVTAFRHAWEMPFSMELLDRSLRSAMFDEAQVRRWATEAEANRDARTLAFASLTLIDKDERARLAERAIALDPKFTWLLYAANINRDRENPKTLEYAKRLQQWQPENAFGYLAEGEYRHHLAKLGATDYAAWSQQAEWRAVMAKAYAAPQYSTFALERFELMRGFMRDRGVDTPLRMVLLVAATPIPNLLNIRTYGMVLTRKLAADAAHDGNTKQAAAYAWTAAHFGERVRMSSQSLIEQLIGDAIVTDAYKTLIPLLQKDGQGEAAASLQSALARIDAEHEQLRGHDVLSQVSNYTWSAFTIIGFQFQVALFAIITLIAVTYVNAKRWVRPQVKGTLYNVMTTAENYVPILLFAACAGLYVAYYPYAVNYSHFMTAKGPMHDFESLIHNSLPIPEAVPGVLLPIGNPLVPYAWYALAGIALVVVAHYAVRTKAQPARNAAGAAAGR